MGNRGDLNGRRKVRRQERVGLVGVDPEDLENRKEVEKEAHAAQDLSKNCRESMSPLSRLIRGFWNKYN